MSEAFDRLAYNLPTDILLATEMWNQLRRFEKTNIPNINNLNALFFSSPGFNKMSSAEPIIRSRQTTKEVNGISTQVVCTEFSNYIFIVITQYGKIGTLISITPDSRSNDISTPTFSTKVLLGKEEVRFVHINVLSVWCGRQRGTCCNTSFHAVEGQMRLALNCSGRRGKKLDLCRHWISLVCLKFAQGSLFHLFPTM